MRVPASFILRPDCTSGRGAYMHTCLCSARKPHNHCMLSLACPGLVCSVSLVCAYPSGQLLPITSHCCTYLLTIPRSSHLFHIFPWPQKLVSASPAQGRLSRGQCAACSQASVEGAGISFQHQDPSHPRRLGGASATSGSMQPAASPCRMGPHEPHKPSAQSASEGGSQSPARRQ